MSHPCTAPPLRPRWPCLAALGCVGATQAAELTLFEHVPTSAARR